MSFEEVLGRVDSDMGVWRREMCELCRRLMELYPQSAADRKRISDNRAKVDRRLRLRHQLSMGATIGLLSVLIVRIVQHFISK